jgi:hypothetical protein
MRRNVMHQQRSKFGVAVDDHYFWVHGVAALMSHIGTRTG